MSTASPKLSFGPQGLSSAALRRPDEPQEGSKDAARRRSGGPQGRHRPRRPRRRRGALLALTAALLGMALMLPAGAEADVGMKIILDCTHHRPITGFSQQDYRKALQDMPTDVSEYGDCWELIQQAEIAAARRGKSSGSGAGGGASGGAQGGGPASGGSGGAGGTGAGGVGAAGEGLTNEEIPQSPAEKQAVASAQTSGDAPVHLGGRLIDPGVVHANLASAASALPAPLIALLALLVACGAAIGGKLIWDRHRSEGEGG